MSYLIYINGMGPNYKGDNIYEFIFSDVNQDIWGENWESKPANGYPLPPDVEYIKKVGTLKNEKITTRPEFIKPGYLLLKKKKSTNPVN